MSLKSIDASIRKIATNAAALNALIHETAMAILNHAKEHGDCTRAQHLLMAMPRSHRRSILVKWFGKYSPIVIKDSDNHVAKMHPKDSKNYVPFDIEGASSEPFFDMADANPERTYDFAALVKMVEGLGKRIHKLVEEGKVPAEDIPSAEAIAVKVEGLRLVRVAKAEAPAPANEPDAAAAMAAAAA